MSFSRENVHTFRPSLLTVESSRRWAAARNWKIGSATNFQGPDRAWTSEREFATLNGRTDLAHVLSPLIRRPLSSRTNFFRSIRTVGKKRLSQNSFPAAWPWTTLAPMLGRAEKIRFLFLSSQIEFPSSLTACPAAAAPPPSECIVVINISEKMKRHWAENSIDDVLGAARPTMSMISRSDGISNALRNERLVANAVTHHQAGLCCLWIQSICSWAKPISGECSAFC